MAMHRVRGHFGPARRKPYLLSALLAALFLFSLISDSSAGVPTEVRVGESVILTLPYQIKRYSVTIPYSEENRGDKNALEDLKGEKTVRSGEYKEPVSPALVQIISASSDRTEIKIDGQYVGKATLIVWKPATAAADGKNYVCIKPHVSSVANRPGAGPAWEKYWRFDEPSEGSCDAWATGVAYDDNKNFFDVNVVLDTTDLAARIAEIAPGDPVKVSVLKNSVIVSGTVSSEDRKARINSVLQSFGRDVKSRDLVYLQGGQTLQLDNTGTDQDKGIKYVNLLEVSDTPQILMQITVASIDRKATRELGINWAYGMNKSIGLFSGAGGATAGFAVLQKAILPDGSRGPLEFNPVGATQSTSLGTGGPQFGVIDPHNNAAYFLKALASKGLAKVLAEPNLLVRNGETGRFLAGGEFPIPVVQSTAAGTGQSNIAITIEFKEFGVKLNLTPIVKENGNIELRMGNNGKDGCTGVGEEDCQGIIVSALDFANAITLSGFRIPALKKDYINTNVELKEGETFVLAGIINEEWSKDLAKIPILGDIPILGAFFRDQKILKAERELVFFVTPKLVQPMAPGQTPAIPGANEPTPEQDKMLRFIPVLPDSMTLDSEKLK